MGVITVNAPVVCNIEIDSVDGTLISWDIDLKDLDIVIEKEYQNEMGTKLDQSDYFNSER